MATPLVTNKDLFEHLDELPLEVLEVVEEHESCEHTYESCNALVRALEYVGYTCDFGLDAEPFGLRPLGTEYEPEDLF